ncbi:hotdog fold thioesterase [Ferruginibacter sp. SUN002]|uniref:hotdog fold thioesterase n=1 Tax=Ferruginibacter sp. SUN002 TaxID=2937789 RepID=UPI003D35A095
MSIWFNKHLRLQDLTPMLEGTMSEHLGMEFIEMGDDFLKMKMPVDNRTKQPYGLLHGGASCTLSETVGSVAAHLVVDSNKFSCVGLEINANHIRSARQGYVTAIATPLHLGTNTHVWDVKISDDAEKLICISRLTIAVLRKAL